MGKKDKRKVKASKQREKQSKFDTQKVLAFAKRYWYWLVVIPLLIVSIILFCYFQGYFEPEYNVKLLSSSPTRIEVIASKSYNMDVTASDGSEVTYSVIEGDEKIVKIEGNVITGVLPGSVRIEARAAGKVKIFTFVVSQTALSWKIPVGEKYKLSIIEDFIDTTYELNSYLIKTTNPNVVEIVMEEEGYFKGKSAGTGIIQVIDDSKRNDDEDVVYAMIGVEVVKDLKQEDVVINSNFSMDIGDIEIDYTNVYKAYDISIGQDFFIEDVVFDKAGTIHYYQKPTEALRLTELGHCFGEKEGESIVTVFCIAQDGTYVYTNVKVRVHPVQITIDGFVGIEITTAELLKMYENPIMSYYKTDSKYLDVFFTPDGNAETFTPNESGKKVIINGYNAENERLVEFTVNTRPREEYLGEEE